MSEDFPIQLAGLRAGSLIAGYRLEAQVGAGGMAVVFRARDQRLGRLVALKILAPAVAGDGAFRRRFIAESRAAASVDDPHIIPVFEADEADGVLFIAMRFVVGGDLRRVLEREGPLAPDRAAAFISPVASALDAAHAAGLVHRDVKPANILVDARHGRPDHVYLSDFGVSKGAMPSVSLTGTGQYLGTADYSAPEQIQGLAVDGRADQYALACVAYELLTGATPFERDHGMAVLLAHLSAPPPSLSSHRPDLPAAADQVLAQAMAKVPEKRYVSCRDFADALREALVVGPYISRGSASVSHHPQTEISSQPEFSGTADPALAATIDSLPGGELARAAGVPAAAATGRSATGLRADDGTGAGTPTATFGERISVPATATTSRQSAVNAEAALRREIRLDPANAQAHTNLGMVLFDSERYPEAETILREAIRLDPANAEAHDILGMVLYATDRYPEAEAAYLEAIRLDPGDAEAQNNLGLVLYATDRYPEAEAAYLEAIRLDPGDAEAHVNLGLVLYATAQDPEAEAAYREAIRLDPANAEAYADLGLVLFDTERYPEAETAVREAIRLDPANAETHDILGLVLYATDRYPEAEAAYREAIRLDRGDAEAHNNLGRLLYAIGRHPEAETALREAIRLDPSYAWAHNNLGLVLHATGRHAEAETAYRKAIRLDPAHAEAHTNLDRALHAT